MTSVRDNIIWNASYKAFRDRVSSSLARARKSLGTIQNQDGLYAEDHRRLIAMYSDVLEVVNRHEKSV